LMTTKPTAAFFSRNKFISNVEPSIEELFLFDEKKRRRRRRRRRQNADTVIHQQCAREIDGPLYGYDQTHCYCNSNQCNSNIQRCIYEVTSKRHFSCYHGTNSSQYPVEILHKCRSCRIYKDFYSIYHYECLTFGEREQNNRTHCTCQRPMCNQDASTCQRLQQAPSRPRTNPVYTTISNSTISTSTSKSTATFPIRTISTKLFTTTIPITTSTTILTTTTVTTDSTSSTPITTTTTTISSTFFSSTTTTLITSTTTISSTSNPTTISETTMADAETTLITATPLATTLSTSFETEEGTLDVNSTAFEVTTLNETTTSFIEIKHLKTVYIEVKNRGTNLSTSLFLNFYFISNIFISFYLFDVIASSIS
ncbi:unnamed protein product, partial [Adineta ricciae]